MANTVISVCPSDFRQLSLDLVVPAGSQQVIVMAYIVISVCLSDFRKLGLDLVVRMDSQQVIVIAYIVISVCISDFRQLGLDLVVRVDSQQVDVDNISPVELYRIHDTSCKVLQGTTVSLTVNHK